MRQGRRNPGSHGPSIFNGSTVPPSAGPLLPHEPTYEYRHACCACIMQDAPICTYTCVCSATRASAFAPPQEAVVLQRRPSAPRSRTPTATGRTLSSSHGVELTERRQDAPGAAEGAQGALPLPRAALPYSLGEIVTEIRTHGAPTEQRTQEPPGLTLRPIAAVDNATAAEFDARCAVAARYV